MIAVVEGHDDSILRDIVPMDSFDGVFQSEHGVSGREVIHLPRKNANWRARERPIVVIVDPVINQYLDSSLLPSRDKRKLSDPGISRFESVCHKIGNPRATENATGASHCFFQSRHEKREFLAKTSGPLREMEKPNFQRDSDFSSPRKNPVIDIGIAVDHV
jgi:hypothetical protein